MMRRFPHLPRRAAAVALALLATWMGGPAAASGGGLPEDLYFLSQRPDLPTREFITGPGSFQPEHRAPYQVVWWWHLTGVPIPDTAVAPLAAVLDGIHRDRWPGENESARQAWQEARSRALAQLGQAPPAGDDGSGLPPWNAATFSSADGCYADAFRNAIATLADRQARHPQARGALLRWLQGQDRVFSRCGGGPAEPDSLPDAGSDAPAWLQHDLAWQEAAGQFYGGELEAAATAYAAIAEEAASPWRHLAAYMQLRVLARQHPGPDASDPHGSPAEAEAAARQAALSEEVTALSDSLLRRAPLAPLRSSIVRLREALLIRHLPLPERLLRLVDGLRAPRDGDTAAARLLLLNQTLRDCSLARCRQPLAGREPEMLRWLYTVRGRPGQEGDVLAPDWQARESWAGYQRTGALPWLFAAARFLPPADRRQARLSAALARLPQRHAGHFAARLLRAGTLHHAGRHAEVRQLLEPLLDAAPARHGASDHNLLAALLLPSARSEAEWLRWALRTPAGRRDPESGEVRPADAAAAGLDHDATLALNTRGSLALLLRLGREPRLNPALQLELLEAAWTRAVLAGEPARAREAGAALLQHYAQLPAKAASVGWLRQAEALSDSDSAGWQRLLLGRLADAADVAHPPHLRGPADWAIALPLPPADGQAEPPRAAGPSSYGKWCDPFGRTGGTLPANRQAAQPFGFLDAAEQQQQQQEAQRLLQVPQDSIWMTQAALALMERAPRDPLVPQALSVAVRLARYSCMGQGSGAWSRRGLQALHKHYPGSPWAARTRYWYGQ